MGNFRDRGSDRGRNNRGSGRRDSGRRDSGPREMFNVKCDKCHKDCQVPFKPSSDKPIYCDDCFRDNKRNSGGRDRSGRNDRGGRGNGRDFGDRQMYKAVCDTCGNNCEIPFQPTSGKPVYCDNCFGKNSSSRSGKADFTEEFRILNEKLDKLIHAMTEKPVKIITPPREIVKELPKKKTVAKKTTTKNVAKKAPAKKVATKKMTKKAPAKKTPAKKKKK